MPVAGRETAAACRFALLRESASPAERGVSRSAGSRPSLVCSCWRVIGAIPSVRGCGRDVTAAGLLSRGARRDLGRGSPVRNLRGSEAFRPARSVPGALDSERHRVAVHGGVLREGVRVRERQEGGRPPHRDTSRPLEARPVGCPGHLGRAGDGERGPVGRQPGGEGHDREPVPESFGGTTAVLVRQRCGCLVDGRTVGAEGLEPTPPPNSAKARDERRPDGWTALRVCGHVVTSLTCAESPPAPEWARVPNCVWSGLTGFRIRGRRGSPHRHKPPSTAAARRQSRFLPAATSPGSGGPLGFTAIG